MKSIFVIEKYIATRDEKYLEQHYDLILTQIDKSKQKYMLLTKIEDKCIFALVLEENYNIPFALKNKCIIAEANLYRNRTNNIKLI